MRWIVVVLLWMMTAVAFAQNESWVHADFRRESGVLPGSAAA